MRRILALLAAVVVAAVLAGCATIPSSGPVRQGEQQEAAELPDLDLLAAGPQPGATQEEILRGFIDAATDPRNNYQIAKEFLTTAFAAEWDPTAAVTIDEFADRDEVVTGEDSIRVVASPVAALRANGQYEVVSSSAPIPLEYKFEAVDDEWRISLAPTGLLMDSADFARVYRQHTLVFFDPEFRFAVPDLRWFAGRDSVQTTIVRELLAGPAEWLDAGVVSAFPEGARLEADSVPITSGVAQVDVDASVEDQRAVQLMEFQLQTSLESVRSVQEVELSLNGAVQDVPGLADAPIVNPRVDARAVAYDGEAFGHLAAGDEGIVPIAGLSDQVAALGPIDAAVGPGDASAAVLAPDGVWLVREGEAAQLLDPRGGLIAPAMDVHGMVWSAPADAPDELVVYPPDGEGVQVPVPWTGSSLAGLEVSRDGTRVIALVVDGGRARFVAAAVERDADGVPIAVGAATLALAEVSGSPLDLAWIDDRTVASLSTADEGGTRLVTQVLAGLATPSTGPQGGVQVDGSNSEREVRVLTSAGEVDTRSGVGWQVRATGIRFLAPQQTD
ncbi:GerMN domain-containing protein [Agromyces sp. MMS24-K17]|uniref:GerMN domain-containing protein n=1 Tax=Agromyces sp. MMS24-K17 TaxID=3372850 RepID=UPI003754C584